MGRLNVYLPDEIEQIMRDLGLKPSELLQEAIVAAVGAADRERELDRYLAEMDAEVGPPSAEDVAWAETVTTPARKAHEQRQAADRARAS